MSTAKWENIAGSKKIFIFEGGFGCDFKFRELWNGVPWTLFLFVYRNPGFPNELNIMQDDSRKCLIYVDRFSTKRENRDGVVVVLKKKIGKFKGFIFCSEKKILWVESNWHFSYNSVFFSQSWMMISWTYFSVSQQLRSDLSAKWISQSS